VEDIEGGNYILNNFFYLLKNFYFYVVSLVNLGVDSLSAIKIRNLLKNEYAIDMPLNVLLGEVS